MRASTDRSALSYHGLGLEPRPHRIRRRRHQWIEEIHRAEPELSDVLAEQRGEERLRQELEKRHPHAYDAWKRLGPTSRSPNREILDEVAIAAIRRQPEARVINELLAHCRFGRPTDRRLLLAVIERMFYGEGRKEVASVYRSLSVKNDALSWALGEPLGPDGARARSLKSIYKGLAAVFERHNPEIVVQQNIVAMRRLSEQHPEIGRYVAVDGVKLEGHFEQRLGVPGEEEDIRRGSDARLGHHGGGNGRRPDTWRGWTAVVLVDLKSTLPLAWMQRPANASESQFLEPLLDLLFEHWPGCPVEYLVGDSAYDSAPLSWALECNYGIHPAIALGKLLSEKTYPHAETRGVPSCSAHGLMQLEWADGFKSPDKRASEGLRRGEVDPKFNPRLRWKCATCEKLRQYTRPEKNARIYTFLPHQGDHPRAGLRVALLARRNLAESVIGSLEDQGVALRGQYHPKWVSSHRQMSWLVSGAFLSMTLRRIALENGDYDQALNEARSARLILDRQRPGN